MIILISVFFFYLKWKKIIGIHNKTILLYISVFIYKTIIHFCPTSNYIININNGIFISFLLNNMFLSI